MKYKKQIKGMPGQEKDYLWIIIKKNPMQLKILEGALYEEKDYKLYKVKNKLTKKELTTQDAEEMISKLNTNKVSQVNTDNKAKNIKIKKQKKLAKTN